MLLHASVGDVVNIGDPLFEIHAETPGELDYARDYASSKLQAFTISEGA